MRRCCGDGHSQPNTQCSVRSADRHAYPPVCPRGRSSLVNFHGSAKAASFVVGAVLVVGNRSILRMPAPIRTAGVGGSDGVLARCNCLAALRWLGCPGCLLGVTEGGSMGGTLARLQVEIGAGSGDDAEHLAQLTYRLRAELLDLDVDAVQVAAAGEAPGDSKGVSLLAAGGLLVRFVGRDALQSIVGSVRSWLGRQHCRSIKLTLDGDSLELTEVTSAEQDRLIDLWVARHAEAG